MGICCSQRANTNKNNKNQLTITKNNLTKFKKNYYSQLTNSSNLPQTSATSNQNQNYTQEIYSFNKYGIQIKTNQRFSRPLKFIFNLYNFKCKMLSENTLYILYIIFDGKDFPMTFGKGHNPTFFFNQTFVKDIAFEKMATSYLEVYLFTYKSNLNDKRNIDFMTKSEILSQAQIFSCFKINLLTLAFAPEKHDLVLIDPKRIRVQLGRISYCVSCKHIEDVHLKIKKFKINLNNLKYNEIALKLKFENKKFNREKESEYTQNLMGEPNDNQNTMIYEYPINKEDDLLMNNISESFAMAKNNFDKLISINSNKVNNNNINNDIKEEKEKLDIHGKMSMIDLYNSETTLNIFSVWLQKNNEPNKIKQKKSFFMKKIELPEIAKISYRKNSNNENPELVYSYRLIGIISLNFYKILNDLEEKLLKISTRLFQSMSNKNTNLVKTLSGSKIMKFGIEEDLTNKVQSNKNLCDINIDEVKYKIENFIINIFENENLNIKEDIFWEGEIIGTIDLTLEISNLPLIRQIRFGVMTETGFELSSIFLYDNLNLSNNLPEEILELNKLKEKLEQEIEIDFSILKKIKSCLEKSAVDNYLYYGFSSNEDLYQGQAIIIDLGIGLFDLLDKIRFEYLHITFQILKLILQRSEFDLGTLSVTWFTKRSIFHQKNSCDSLYHSMKSNFCNYDCDCDEIEYEFMDNSLVTKRIIEKYLNFHAELLSFCLNNLNKGKNISKDSMEFTYFYLAIAFFQNPQFRNSFIKVISNSIDLKDKNYTKFLSRINNFYSRKDSINTNNFRIWDILFYQRLESAINTYLYKIKRKSTENNSNKIECINAIKEQLMNIKNLTEIKEEKSQKNDLIIFHHSKWYEKISKRDYIFYDLVLEILDQLNELRNQYTNKSSNLINFKSPENILNFVDIEKLLKVIKYDLITKKGKFYPKQIKELIPKFYADSKEINNLIYIMFTTTNVYDTTSIFNLIEILDDLFNKKFEYNSYLKDEIDCTIVKKAFVIIIDSDNSLAIAKFIWFYYKNNSLINFHHMNDIIKYIISIFFKLFFHWSFQIREIFYFFIVFILGYKLKGKFKSKNEKNQNINNLITNLDKKATFYDDFMKKKRINKEEDFYLLDELSENMEIIARLQKIIKTEKYQEAYLDNVINIKDEKILEKIPKDPHGNIIECLRQYNNVVTKFGVWKKNIEEEKIPEDKIEYPQMEIAAIKDDKIQYESIYYE